MRFKACGRCNGDIYIEDDLGSRDLVCLQCGSRRAIDRPGYLSSQKDAQLIRWMSSERPAARAAA